MVAWDSVGLIAWVDMAKCHRDGDNREEENERGNCRGRDELAVDVMTIVGKILCGGPTLLNSRV
jgi:hypothetical protein